MTSNTQTPERQGASRRFRIVTVTRETPAASALPLTGQTPRDLKEVGTELVSGTALAAGESGNNVAPPTPAASALPLTRKPPSKLNEVGTELVSGTALAAGESPNNVALARSAASAVPLIMIGELSQ